MSDTPHQGYTVIPPGELRCVWMTAGILSYQLCDRAYECDGCALDAAMRKHFSDTEPRERTAPSEGRTLRETCRYADNHCWLKSVSEHVARIGIEPGLASVLLVPKAIVLPSVGQRVMKRQAIVWFVMEDGTLPLSSPVDGEVVGRNGLILENPRELLAHPFDGGWLYDISVEPPAITEAQLFEVPEANRRYTRDSLRLNELLKEALEPRGSTVGDTLPDGGKPLQDVSDMIGSRNYFRIINQVYGSR